MLKSAWAREVAWEECLQVLGFQAQETRQDQTRAAAPDLAEIPARDVEWAEWLALLNEEKRTAFFSDAVGEDTDAGELP